MKKRVFLLPALFLAMAVPAAMAANGGNPDGAAAPADSAVADSPMQEKLLKQVYMQVADTLKTELNEVKSEVAAMKQQMEESEAESGPGIGSMLLSLLLGAGGGMAAYFYMKSKEKPLPDTKEPGAAYTAPRDNKSGNNTAGKRNADAGEQKNDAQTRTRKTEDAVSHYDTPEVKPAPKPAPKPTPKPTSRPDARRTAYGDIMIPDADMLIIEDRDLRDSSNGQPFQFDINETKGTATFTFAPGILNSVLSNLSSYEQFLEPFDFNPAATTLTVVSPGTLTHMPGYWQVEKRITISLS